MQHILDANRLTWSDVGHHPDCQFASFIHASQQRDLIIDTPSKFRTRFRKENIWGVKPREWMKRMNGDEPASQENGW
jgi:hypothetical protein